FVGCTPSLLRRGIARGTYSLLEACGVDFAVLEDETCCGHPFLAMGMPDRTRQALDENLERIRQSGAETLVFACPGCLRTFREDYVKLTGHPLPVHAMHITEYLAELPAFRELRLKRQGRLVTYHDPCTLGRSLGILGPPRQLIDAIPGVKRQEMPRNGSQSFCCGSGGFVRTDHEGLSIATEAERFAEALATGADTIVSACPACQTAFLDAKQRASISSSVDVLDIVELLAAAL
nr:(Fe-S)-binding protein [Candidatus Bipolaricaulota bacterium]